RADVRGPHLPVGDPRRRDQDLVTGAHAHVACAADGQPVVEQADAVADELLAVLATPARIVAAHYPDRRSRATASPGPLPGQAGLTPSSQGSGTIEVLCCQPHVTGPLAVGCGGRERGAAGLERNSL